MKSEVLKMLLRDYTSLSKMNNFRKPSVWVVFFFKAKIRLTKNIVGYIIYMSYRVAEF